MHRSGIWFVTFVQLFQHCTNTVSTAGKMGQLSLLRGRVDNNKADDGSPRTVELVDAVIVDWFLLMEVDKTRGSVRVLGLEMP